MNTRILVGLGLAVTMGAIAASLPAATLPTVPVDEKTLAQGVQAQTMAVKLPDAGLAYVVYASDGGVTLLKQSPCAWKPVKAAACTKLDGGDPGVANTMQPGTWTGAGCVRKSCVIYSGDPDDDTLLPVKGLRPP